MKENNPKKPKNNMNKAIILAFILSFACFSTTLANSQTKVTFTANLIVRKCVFENPKFKSEVY